MARFCFLPHDPPHCAVFKNINRSHYMSRHLMTHTGTYWWTILFSRSSRAPQIIGAIMENSILDLQELATMLGRSPETIKKDLRRNHLAVPPRLHIPGTRLLRWRRVDVEAWLASHVDVSGRALP